LVDHRKAIRTDCANIIWATVAIWHRALAAVTIAIEVIALDAIVACVIIGAG
jgi:hypothetical protein